MKKRFLIFASILLTLFLITNIFAIYTEEDSKISFGHSLRVINISVPDLSPGEYGLLKINIKNNAAYSVSDVRSRLILPSQLQFIEDVNEIRIAELKSGEVKEISYSIIALPKVDEGIYGANLLMDYISHFGVNSFNVGQDNSDNYSFGIEIKSIPSIFVQLDSSDLYKGKVLGNINLKFVNNGTSNIRFLTVNLLESSDYEVISDNKNYVGDLDSNDFQTVNYNINIKNERDSIDIPIRVSFMDSMNNNYNKDMKVTLKIRSASEVGKSDKTYYYIIGIAVIVILIVAYYFYRNLIRRKEKRRL
jgi:hypothetical protein